MRETTETPPSETPAAPEPTVPYEIRLGNRKQPFHFKDGVIPQKNLDMAGEMSSAEANELAGAFLAILKKRK